MIAILTGCASADSGQPTAAGCAAVAVDTVRQHAPMTRLPPACRRLGAAGLSQAVRIAVGQLAQQRDKARRRHMAYLARAHLAALTGAAQRAELASEARMRQRAIARARDKAEHRAGTRSSSRAAGIQVPIQLAALLAWLLTAASGGWVLAVIRAHRRARGGSRRRRWPPAVILGHAGLAIGGLVLWAGYLLIGFRPLAWAAFGVLLPVTGLGMATLMQSITGRDTPASAPHTPASAPASRAPMSATTMSATTVTTATVAPAPAWVSPVSRRAPVLMIAAHGALATLTILLTLLSAIAAVAG
jgi:hypothetical protein